MNNTDEVIVVDMSTIPEGQTIEEYIANLKGGKK